LAKKSGFGAQKEAISQGEVGFRTPTHNLYKPKVFDSPNKFRMGEMLNNWESQAIFMQGGH
jgi:hypothetical protein